MRRLLVLVVVYEAAEEEVVCPDGDADEGCIA
jgi:hypothetical protein